MGREIGVEHGSPVKDLCIFTTHTPVAAGHDKFSYDIVTQNAGRLSFRLHILQELGGRGRIEHEHAGFESQRLS